MKRGVKASLSPALDEIVDLCYSQAEGARKAEVAVKVKRRSKEWRKANQP
jgi:anti-sigma factor ChrR (cupin superfamily)